MARVARERSSTGTYHVVFRGINRQIIFEDNQDRARFLDTLEEYKDICEFIFYGYCLMDNHVHLLIKETKESVSGIIKCICSSYVYWYNACTAGTGSCVHAQQGQIPVCILAVAKK